MRIGFTPVCESVIGDCMSDEELMQKNIELKVILTSSGVNLIELDIIKE